jgi:conjugal transfer mating pair stabilization protein TraG
MSTRFEAGKQAGPDTIEHFLGSGPEGQAAMANWLRGGFEMDRRGDWRLKPQVADTLQRDVTAIIAQTGWNRSLSRSAEHSTADSQSISGDLTALASRGIGSGGKDGEEKGGGKGSATGSLTGKLSADISDRGIAAVVAQSSIDTVNYDVREAIASAEKTAARSGRPEEAFAKHLSEQVLGNDGLRNRYLRQADAGRGTVDVTGPITSMEQSSILSSGRLLFDRDNGMADGDSSFKERRDP